MQHTDEKRDEWELEEAADALIRGLPLDPNCPTTTEYQLMRPRCEGRWLGFADVADAVAGDCRQSAVEELEFLLHFVALSARERASLLGWMSGCSQEEASEPEQTGLPSCSQQTVSKSLVRGIRKCWNAAGGLTFRAFSRHTIHHPVAAREHGRMLQCPRCDEWFRVGLGCGRFCSSGCKEASRR